MSTFERYLSVWVALCIVVGIALGHLMPGVFAAVSRAEIARVNLPIAVLSGKDTIGEPMVGKDPVEGFTWEIKKKP